MTKNKKENKINHWILSIGLKLKRNKVFTIAVTISFLILTVLIYFRSYENSGLLKLNISDFEVGMVADRDVIANRKIETVDKQATELRKSAVKHSIRPVFYADDAISASAIKEFSEFANYVIGLKETSSNFTSFKFAIIEKYPTLISEADMQLLYDLQDFYEITSIALSILRTVFELGIVEMPLTGLEELHNTEITILSSSQNYKNAALTNVILLRSVKSHIKRLIEEAHKSEFEKQITIAVMPFIKANILFSSEETQKRVDDALKRISPVKISIAKNQRILKRGFIIGEDAYAKLLAYANDGKYIDWNYFIASIIFLTLSLIASLFLFSKKIIGQSLSFDFNLLILISFDLVYILLLFVKQLPNFTSAFSVLPILPVTFFTMLIAALVSRKIAVSTVFVLTLAVFGSSHYEIEPTLFTLFSGLASAACINITGQRMDLIKTASLLAIIQPVISFCIVFIFQRQTHDISYLILGTAVNGFISGVLVLGFLPILEALMNVPTSFRLMELSDLNSAIMKKMLLTVAGTYNHSMMVASLAESACREIGANSILARVGAYYHDIGKMEQGEYYVENQSSYNKHDELPPRLSATLIRSHVKLGVEKARQLHLPQAVIDIIAEHHGNGCISYFYSKAKQEDPNVDIKDFCYPGKPPTSKESAVVMLADTVEAACRTLEKPSVPRLEKFIGELVEAKIKAGQLDNSNLTFREVNIVKKSFVTMLAAYYHSRIKYPNQKKNDNEQNTENVKGLK